MWDIIALRAKHLKAWSLIRYSSGYDGRATCFWISSPRPVEGGTCCKQHRVVLGNRIFDSSSSSAHSRNARDDFRAEGCSHYMKLVLQLLQAEFESKIWEIWKDSAVACTQKPTNLVGDLLFS
jgi:hypothetical protein